MDLFIKGSGTFLEPNVEDEGNNWANRVGFLESFRKLKSFMDEHNLYNFHADLIDDDFPF